MGRLLEIAQNQTYLKGPKATVSITMLGFCNIRQTPKLKPGDQTLAIWMSPGKTIQKQFFTNEDFREFSF